MSRLALVLLVLVAVALVPAEASKVKTWQTSSAASYDKAKFKEAVISNQGVVRLSKQLKPLAKFDAAHVWDVVEDGALIKTATELARRLADGPTLSLARIKQALGRASGNELSQQLDIEPQFGCRLRKQKTRNAVAGGICVPVHRTVGRLDMQCIAENRCPAVCRRSQANVVRTQHDAAVEIVSGVVTQRYAHT